MPQDPVIVVKKQEEPGLASVAEVLGAFRGVRAAVADLFAAVGVDPTKTRDSARVLGLNRGLTWKLTRVVRETDAQSVVNDVPGRQSISKFLTACRELGAPEEALDAAQSAYDEFEKAVDSCSGDRKTLAMVMANRGERSPAIDRERARRKLFEGACAVWGVQAQVRFVTVFLFPSPDDPTRLDAGHVTGYLGFRRLTTRPWPMSFEAVHDAGGQAQRIRKKPLDPIGVGEGELQLLKQFCSPEKPKIDVRRSGTYKVFELAPGPVGNRGLTTCVFGSHLEGIYPRYTPEPDTAGFMVLLQAPVERVIFDFFVHESLGATEPATTHLLDRLAYPHDNREDEFDHQSIPIVEKPEMLPRGIPGALTPYIPWYPKLLSFVCQRTGQAMDAFHGSRFEMSYPPIATTLSRRIDLSAPPA